MVSTPVPRSRRCITSTRIGEKPVKSINPWGMIEDSSLFISAMTGMKARVEAHPAGTTEVDDDSSPTR